MNGKAFHKNHNPAPPAMMAVIMPVVPSGRSQNGFGFMSGSCDALMVLLAVGVDLGFYRIQVAADGRKCRLEHALCGLDFSGTRCCRSSQFSLTFLQSRDLFRNTLRLSFF